MSAKVRSALVLGRNIHSKVPAGLFINNGISTSSRPLSSIVNHQVRRVSQIKHACVLSRRTFHSSRTLCDNTQDDKHTESFNSSQDRTSDKLRITEEMEFIIPEQLTRIPMYRVLGLNGEVLNEQHNPQLDREMLIKMYKTMTQLSILDHIMYESQRQGRISFYMTNRGEEGLQVASAAAMTPEDYVYAQYREAGVVMWRGMSLYLMMSQCYGNADDLEKGRSMPVHYGSKDLNVFTISSTLATQIPQAAGSAYALKRDGKGQCVICYFGDGAASEGDAHAAFNFAATLECPVIFFCRNNGYAISTSTDEQYKGDGIASRGSGYGMITIRIDGNDVFAVYNATKTARSMAVKYNRPVLIEAMTYRVGHHSTSDDSSAYRDTDDLDHWNERDNPMVRLKVFMVNEGIWNEDLDKEWLHQARQEVMTEFKRADQRIKPSPDYLFTDVYDVMPKRLQEQYQELKKLTTEFPEHYPLKQFEKMK